MANTKILVYKYLNDEYHIEVGKVYTVEYKSDMNAPDGFRKLGTKKLPNPVTGAKSLGIGLFNSKRGSIERPYFDTFLDETSSYLNELYPDLVSRKEAIKNLNKLIVEPIENIYGEGQLNPRSNFWRSKEARTTLYKGKRFNTNDPVDLFQLYCLICNKELAPQEFANKPLFIYNSSFTIVNADEVTDVKTKNSFAKTTAISRFVTLMSSDKEKLYSLFKYIGINLPIDKEDKDSEEMINLIFTEWIESFEQNISIFNSNYEELISKKSGSQVLVVFDNLNKMINQGIAKIEFGNVIIEDMVVGGSIKDASSKIISDKDKKGVYNKALEELKK